MAKIKALKVRVVRVPMAHPHLTAGGIASESPLVKKKKGVRTGSGLDITGVARKEIKKTQSHRDHREFLLARSSSACGDRPQIAQMAAD
jgi:hypothetical protein